MCNHRVRAATFHFKPRILRVFFCVVSSPIHTDDAQHSSIRVRCGQIFLNPSTLLLLLPLSPISPHLDRRKRSLPSFRSIFSLSTWRMVVVLFLPSLTLCREIFDSHHSRYQHDSTGVFPSSRSPLLFLLCSLACTDRRIKSTWKLECTALPLLLPWLLTRNILVVNCGGGGDSRAAWRPERRTKECRLERRGLTRINANWAAATGSSSSSSSIFVAANGSVAVLAFLHPPASILRCFRCALVP